MTRRDAGCRVNSALVDARNRRRFWRRSSLSSELEAENLDVFDFELTLEEMNAIATLETGASSFFDHRDPAMVKWLSEAKRPT